MSSKQSKTIRKKIENDPEFRKRWIEKSRKGARVTNSLGKRHIFTKEEKSKGGKRVAKIGQKFLRERERKIKKSLEKDYDKLFWGAVIDGIGFKNENIEFVEIKQGNHSLTKNQRQFRKWLNKIGKELRIVRIPLDQKI